MVGSRNAYGRPAGIRGHDTIFIVYSFSLVEFAIPGTQYTTPSISKNFIRRLRRLTQIESGLSYNLRKSAKSVDQSIPFRSGVGHGLRTKRFSPALRRAGDRMVSATEKSQTVDLVRLQGLFLLICVNLRNLRFIFFSSIFRTKPGIKSFNRRLTQIYAD